jgi:hypothetical protein
MVVVPSVPACRMSLPVAKCQPRLVMNSSLPARAEVDSLSGVWMLDHLHLAQ